MTIPILGRPHDVPVEMPCVVCARPIAVSADLAATPGATIVHDYCQEQANAGPRRTFRVTVSVIETFSDDQPEEVLFTMGSTVTGVSVMAMVDDLARGLDAQWQQIAAAAKKGLLDPEPDKATCVFEGCENPATGPVLLGTLPVGEVCDEHKVEMAGRQWVARPEGEGVVISWA